MTLPLRIWQPAEPPGPRQPRKGRRLPTFYRKPEIELLLATADAQIEHAGKGTNTKGHKVCNLHPYRYALQDKLIVVLGCFCGLRYMESAGLRVEDVDLIAGDLFVCGKGGVERLVPIKSDWREYLAWWCRYRKLGWLLRSKSGGRLADSTVNCRLKRLAKLAGLAKRIHSHALRHTFCTRIIEEGGDVFDVRDLAGHKSLASTQLYVHCVPEKRRNAVERI
jgi:site-specific recombinase XerD